MALLHSCSVFYVTKCYITKIINVHINVVTKPLRTHNNLFSFKKYFLRIAKLFMFCESMETNNNSNVFHTQNLILNFVYEKRLNIYVLFQSISKIIILNILTVDLSTFITNKSIHVYIKIKFFRPMNKSNMKHVVFSKVNKDLCYQGNLQLFPYSQQSTRMHLPHSP